MIHIEKITGELAQSLCQTITMDLPEYFGFPEANEHYAIGVKTRTNFAAKDDDVELVINQFASTFNTTENRKVTNSKPEYSQ